MTAEALESTVAGLLSRGRARLDAARVPEAAANAEWLLSSILSVSRGQLQLKSREAVAPRDLKRFDRLVGARCRRLPLAYVLGVQNFMGLELAVSSDVLVPRPETEEVVQAAIDLYGSADAKIRILDIGTGSGCIAITLARFIPSARIDAIDASVKAIAVAKLNAKQFGLTSRVRFKRQDFFLKIRSPQLYDLIISNPPYIRSESIADLDPEVQFEPKAALDGGHTGLEAIEAVILNAACLLKPGGWLVLEIDQGQGRAVKSLMRHARFGCLEVRRDSQGFERIAIGRK